MEWLAELIAILIFGAVLVGIGYILLWIKRKRNLNLSTNAIAGLALTIIIVSLLLLSWIVNGC